MASGYSGASGAFAVDLRMKMDALVSDLSHALDESQLTPYHRKRRGLKRRSKASISMGLPHCGAVSEDSSSSVGEVLLSQDNKSSLPLSDSDDLSPPPDPRMRAPPLLHRRLPANLVESDSFNENFSPARTHNKRKQKWKRLALDPDAPSTSVDRTQFHGSVRKRRTLRPGTEADSKFVEVSAGKRKRGRDRSSEWDACRRLGAGRSRQCGGPGQVPLGLPMTPSDAASPTYSGEEYMDLDVTTKPHTSESSPSSGSDAGGYTCDEGREADDEQSDWVAEPGAVYGVPGGADAAPGLRVGPQRRTIPWWNDHNMRLSPSAKAHFKERYERMSQETHQACRLRFQKLRERLLRREIRAGRRRLQERRPGFSIVSSVNDKVSRFLQDPGQMELRLKPMPERDRDQLRHLAKLYSLNVRPGDDLTAPILTKTRKTITTTQLDVCGRGGEAGFPGAVPVPLSDLKRRRRTPPPGVHNLTEGSNDSVESVIIACSGAGSSVRPPVPTASWGDDDLGGDCCGDSLSERLADSEPDPVPSPTSLALHDCTL